MNDTPHPLWKRLGWLIAIWTMSVGSLALVGGVIRYWLKP
ncbi:DUF2474 domain-containing protein [Sphingobium sp. UBA5915]|nr:DUF2474 domain-containing protein [Sphingobium sp. UBA5915]